MKFFGDEGKLWYKICRSRIALAIFGLLIILIAAFSYLFGVLLAEEMTTTSIRIVTWAEEMTTTGIRIVETSGSFKLTTDSQIFIDYVPGERDEITFFLKFENLDGNQLTNFSISWDGEMKSKRVISMEGIEEVSQRNSNGLTWRYYEVDFQNNKAPEFWQEFYCNLFADKLGEVRLHLFLTGSKEIFNNIPVYFAGLDKFNLERAFPKPEKEYLHLISYVYRVDDESFLNGIMLRGNNPTIERTFQVKLFVLGAIIAAGTGALTTLVVDLLRRKGRIP